jgi:AcrR family transcriptional regulator
VGCRSSRAIFACVSTKRSVGLQDDESPAAAAPGRGGRGLDSSRGDEILVAAARMFWEKGYAATSVADIADAVGLLKGSLYHYISSKEELLFRIVDSAHRDALEAIKKKLIGRGAVEGIRTFVRESVVFVAEHPEQSAAFYLQWRHLTGEHLRTIRAIREENEALLEQLIRRGQEDGTVRADTDAKLLTLCAFSSITSLHNWYRRGGSWSPSQLGDTFADFAIEGLKSH